MGYESVWSFGYGMQYQASTRLQLRAGFEPRKTAIPDDRLNVQAPLGDANLYSIGAGYLWDKDSVIDLSLSFMQSIEEINAGDSVALNQPASCLTCVLTSPYPDLDVKTKLIVGSLGFTFRTKF
jgi:long-subunit fatty acid transport protein